VSKKCLVHQIFNADVFLKKYCTITNSSLFNVLWRVCSIPKKMHSLNECNRVYSMFVYIKYEDSIRPDIFGPATKSECESWLKIMKIYPRDCYIWWGQQLNDSRRMLPEKFDQPWI